MKGESENSTKLSDFFNREYQSLKVYVNTRIEESAERSAEDIIQDVALKLFSGTNRYGPIHNVAGFVYRSLKNRIIDVMRTTRRSEIIDTDEDLMNLSEVLTQSADPGSSEALIGTLKRCINELKPPYRDIIIAVDFEGYSYKEIAHETGIPEGTLMSRRHRAIGILYKKLEITNLKLKNHDELFHP